MDSKVGIRAPLPRDFGRSAAALLQRRDVGRHGQYGTSDGRPKA